MEVGLFGLLAACVVEITVASVIFYTTLIFAGFVTVFTPCARPVVVVEIVGDEKFFDEVWW